MIPALLITFREVLEASLIVATILGILTKLGRRKDIKTVCLATSTAGIVSILFLCIGSLLGLKVQEFYSGAVEQLTEGSLMILSAIFVTWAVFFLHTYFTRHKVKLLQKVKATMGHQEQRTLFMLVFTAVFREGIEIVLFLSTIYFSANPREIVSGFLLGMTLAIVVAFGFFSATLRMPVYYAFRVTSLLLILFAAGLLVKGVHEFTEIGFLPEFSSITLSFIPRPATLSGDLLTAIFGISQKMNIIQLTLYGVYMTFMNYWVFVRKQTPLTQS